MKKPKISIDFNEMIDDEYCLLSKEDTKTDIEGNVITLTDSQRHCRIKYKFGLECFGKMVY